MTESPALKQLKVLIVAGSLGAGKSSAAKYLATRNGFQHLSFVRAIWIPILQERKLPVTRDNLQLLGIELMETVGPLQLVRQLLQLAATDRHVVIDDVRRRDVVDIIRAECSSVFLVFIRANFETRYPRLVARDGITSPAEQERAETVKTETTIPDLESAADRMIDNDGDLSQFHKTLDHIAVVANAAFGIVKA